MREDEPMPTTVPGPDPDAADFEYDEMAYFGENCDEHGLVAPDLVPHPAMAEVAWLGRPVRVRTTAAGLRRGEVRLWNAQWFRDLSWLRATVEVTVDGRPHQRVALALPDLAPQAEAAVALGVDVPESTPGQELRATVRFVTA